jgi:hypothetical protein
VAVPDVLECLAGLANDAGNYHEAARLFGAAEAIRKRIGLFRFVIHQAVFKASVAALRDAMGEEDFDAAWAEGAALSPRRRSPTRSAAAANAKRRAFRLLHALALEAEARGHSVRLPKRNMHGYVAASWLGGNMIVQVGEIQCSMVIWQPKDRVPHTPTPTSTIRIATRVVCTTWTAHRCVAVDWTRDGEPAGRRIFWLELESRWGRAEKRIA